jgi:hypothetical protein
MSEIGVFHRTGAYSIFYTCCCRAMIRNNQDNCPQCKKRIISSTQRERFTRGEMERAKQARFVEAYMRSGKYEAGKIAARLKGEVFYPPTLCRTCGDPEPECKCIPTEW